MGWHHSFKSRRPLLTEFARVDHRDGSRKVQSRSHLFRDMAMHTGETEDHFQALTYLFAVPITYLYFELRHTAPLDLLNINRFKSLA